MLHPLLHLIATQPHLLADHAEAYADLVSAEARTAVNGWKRRAVLFASALCCLGVTVVLAGVALMLWAVVPLASAQAAWALVAVPLPTLALSLWCWLSASTPEADSAFDNVRRQIKADIVMMRAAGLP